MFLRLVSPLIIEKESALGLKSAIPYFFFQDITSPWFVIARFQIFISINNLSLKSNRATRFVLLHPPDIKCLEAGQHISIENLNRDLWDFFETLRIFISFPSSRESLRKTEPRKKQLCRAQRQHLTRKRGPNFKSEDSSTRKPDQCNTNITCYYYDRLVKLSTGRVCDIS